jgi:DNA-binding transcriptional MerR regulator
MMKAYTVSQLAKMAGVSVRTLHYYDKIGLLKPSSRSDAGDRQYQWRDLLRLQQILFFKELDLPLREIQAILDDPDFDEVQALQGHRRRLEGQMARLTQLLHTLDKTLLRLTEDTMPLSDEELYEGFTKEQRERYEREAKEMYDPEVVQATNQRIRRLNKQQWEAVKAEGDDVTREIAALTDQAPDAAEVQALIAHHHAWVENFYPANAEVYRGLGHLYTEHEEFRAFYEKFHPGLADFMCAAMMHYVDTVLAKKA